MGIFNQAIKQGIKQAKKDAKKEKDALRKQGKSTPLMDKILAGQINSHEKIDESLRKIAPKSKHEKIEPPEWWPAIPIISVAETMPGLSTVLKPLLSLQIEARDQQILRALSKDVISRDGLMIEVDKWLPLDCPQRETRIIHIVESVWEYLQAQGIPLR